MFEKMHPIPNHIFVPKITPLVYDDTLSYYEFLCKLINVVNLAIEKLNDLGVRVDDLEEAVRQLQDIVSGLDERITACEGDIADIKLDIESINGAIENINTAIEGVNTQISNLSTTVQGNTNQINTINNTLRNIQDDISSLEGLPGDVSGLESEVDNLDTRVTNLESATFGDVSVSPVPVNFGCYCIDPDMIDYEIVQDTTTPDPDWDWTVQMASNPLYQNGKQQIRFRGNENYNKSHLVIHNFMPHMQNADPLTLLVKYNYSWDYTSNCQAVNTSFGALVNGINCVLGDYSTICIGGAQLVPSSTNSDIYDLVLSAQSLSGSGTWIDNSAYFLNYVAILGGVGYLSDGRINFEDGEKYFNCFNASVKQGVSQSDFDTLSGRVTTAENDIDSLETAIGNFTYSEYVTDFNNLIGDLDNIHSKDDEQDGKISDLETAVGNLTPYDYTGFSDVFDLSSLPSGASVQYFRAYKYGALRIIDFIITGLDKNSTTSNVKLGTIRSGAVSDWAPYWAVNSVGNALKTTADVPPRIQLAVYPSVYPSGKAIKHGMVTLTGSVTTNPFNEGSQSHVTTMSANSLYCAFENDYGEDYNSIQARLVYLVGH